MKNIRMMLVVFIFCGFPVFAGAATFSEIGLAHRTQTATFTPVFVHPLLKGRIYGSVNGKSVLAYYGSCDKIKISAVNVHTQKVAMEVKAIAADGACAYSMAVGEPFDYAIDISDPSGYVVNWLYQGTWPSVGQALVDNTVDAEFKSIASADILKPMTPHQSGQMQESPSLKITALTFDPVSYHEGDKVVMNCLVKNTGKAPVKIKKLSLIIKGKEVDRKKYDTSNEIEAGKYAYTSQTAITWQGISCQTDFEVGVYTENDGGLRLEDKIPGKTNCCPSTGPNLSTHNFYYNGTGLGSVIYQGEMIDGRYEVVNTEKQPSPPAKFRLNTGHMAIGASGYNEFFVEQQGTMLFNIPSIAPNQTYVGTFYAVVESCDKGVQIVLDPLNEIAETREDDNKTAFQFGFGGSCFKSKEAYDKSLLPDLTVGHDLGENNLMTKGPDAPGGVIALHAGICNHSKNAGAPGSKVVLKVNGKTVEEKGIGGIGIGYFCRQVSFTYANTSCNTQFTVEVDPGQQVQDGDRSNNSMTAMYKCQ